MKLNRPKGHEVKGLSVEKQLLTIFGVLLLSKFALLKVSKRVDRTLQLCLSRRHVSSDADEIIIEIEVFRANALPTRCLLESV